MALVSKNFSDIITFTRASSATYFDSTGTLQTATTNAPRFDYDPTTLAIKGLLIEEQRTNSIRNNTMVGAVAGSPGTLPTNWSWTGGGLTATVLGIGTESGINYIDIQFSGTASATSAGLRFEQTTQIAAASGQAWNGSLYVRSIAGTNSNISTLKINLIGRTSGGAATSDNLQGVNFLSSLVASNIALNRQNMTGTLADATSAFLQPQLIFALTNGTAVDITLRIGLPQLEQGAFATSVIATSGAAATRAADVATINALSPWFNAAGGTIYLEAYGAGGSTTAQAIVLTDGTTEIESIRNFSNSARFVAQSVASASAAAISNASIYKAAYAFASGDQAMSVNGAAPLTGTTAITSTPTLMRLGTNMGGNGGFLNSWIRKLTYYPARLTNAQLQSLTA